MDRIYIITDIDMYEPSCPEVTNYVTQNKEKAEGIFQRCIDEWKKFSNYVKQNGNEIKIYDSEEICVGFITLKQENIEN